MERVFNKPKGTYDNASFSSYLSNRINTDYCPGASRDAVYTAIRDGQFNRTRNVILKLLSSFEEYNLFLNSN